MNTARATRTFTVAYRTGGTAAFAWRTTVPFSTYDLAEQAAGDIRRGGRKALVFDTARLDSIGLPETWEAGDVVTGTADDAARYAVSDNRDPNS